MRSDWWVGFGGGIASLGFGGDAGTFPIQREAGLAMQISGGRALSPRISLGAEANVWTKESAGAVATVWTTSGVLVVFPWARRGWWAKGGLGALILDESDIGNSGTGVALTLALGRDFDIGGGRFVTPFFQATLSSGVEIEQNGAATGFTEDPDLLYGGVSLMWR